MQANTRRKTTSSRIFLIYVLRNVKLFDLPILCLL